MRPAGEESDSCATISKVGSFTRVGGLRLSRSHDAEKSREVACDFQSSGDHSLARCMPSLSEIATPQVVVTTREQGLFSKDVYELI